MINRRRPTPWLHRWSRILIAAIAGLGALVTGYLTVTKFVGGSAACPTQGCEQVLSSPYATVFGLPLTLFGFLAYGAMAGMAIAPLFIKPETNKALRSQVEHWTWLLLFAGATAMTVFSAYLMFVLTTQIQAICIYCVASALFSLSLLVLTVLGRAWDDVGQLFFTAIVVGMVTLIGTLGVYAQIDRPAGSSGTSGYNITSVSGPAEVELAKHLTQVGAKMYGAYWCPHCHDQKELFGQEAAKQITYIECDPQGPNAQPNLCQAAKIQGYPSWEINGQIYSGTQSLETLANVTNYQGPRNFQNPLGR